MYYDFNDERQKLQDGAIITKENGEQFVVDRYIGSGGFSLCYLAHIASSYRYVVLKEFYPKRVEKGVACRRADGKIVVYDPLSETVQNDDEEAWNDAFLSFEREVRLSRKAAYLYDAAGKRIRQNNPDTLSVSDPFCDVIGNLYIAVDTAQGETLKELIDRGFVRNSSGEIVSQGSIANILEILLNTTQLLARLHSYNRILHLDISPENIYLTASGAGQRLLPHILDFGSAIDLDDSTNQAYHHYTCNSFSAPEIMALADLDDDQAGYSPDESSDTYAVAAILFYALTGKVYSLKSAYDTKWKDNIRDEYSMTSADDSGGKSFSEQLIEFLETGLSSSQKQRYHTAEEMAEALRDLSLSVQERWNLLNLIEPDELMTYLMLDKYPLYQYVSNSGALEILCLGAGTFTRRFILSAISCGQMLGKKLKIHVVGASNEEDFRAGLFSKAPLIDAYSDLTGEKENDWVSISYQYIEDLLQPEIATKIAKVYCECHYLIVSLGSDRANIQLARACANAFSEAKIGAQKTVVHFHVSSAASEGVHRDDDSSGIVELVPFNERSKSYVGELRSLGQRALRLSHLYDKLSAPRTAMVETKRRFAADKYGQRSSCASALHLKYKLASVGINPSSSTNYKAIIPAYRRALDGPALGQLLELEHRRWMMYMIADGYRLPTIEQLEFYSFEYGEDHSFNASFKDTKHGYHHCLVPCSSDGICLPKDHQAWDKFESLEEIDKSSYDELDKMSLKVHFLAGKKIRDHRQAKKLLDDYRNGILSPLERKLTALQELRKEDQDDLELKTGRHSSLDAASKLCKQLLSSLSDLTESGIIGNELEMLSILADICKEAGINIAKGVEDVKNDLAVYVEYARYRDYKAPDLTIIEHLLWLLYAEDDLKLIKLGGHSVQDNVLSPLILLPKTLVFFGMDYDSNLEKFFYGHGFRGSIRFEQCREDGFQAVYERLRSIRDQIPGKCVIDLTGSDETSICAAMLLNMNDHSVMLVRSNCRTLQLENLAGFYKAEAYSIPVTISADEIYSLYGATALPVNNRYMLRLGNAAEKLWGFYREFQKDWEMVTAFFANRGKGSSELRLYGVSEGSTGITWRKYSRTIGKDIWSNLKLDDCFSKMEISGFIKNLTTSKKGSDGLVVSFEYPGEGAKQNDDKAFKALNWFFGSKLYNALGPFQCWIGTDNKGTPVLSLESGSYVSIADRSALDFADKRNLGSGEYKRFPYKAVFPALHRLADMGMISDLKTEQSADGCPITVIEFAYSDLAIRDCLMVSGNVLELYAWYSAFKTGEFDDCKANHAFRWKEGVENELDLILTKGLSTLVISCKTAKFNKAHLYEIRYLTDRFSLNSKAVIIYSSLMAVDDEGHLSNNIEAVKERARAMGIYLIDLNEIPDGGIGEVLVRIADGR